MRQAARTSRIGAALLGTLAVSALPPPVSATERGWNTTIVTGAVNSRPTRAAKSLPPTLSAEPLETGSVPPVEAQAAQASGSPAGKPAGERARSGSGDMKPAQHYCINIANAAADARAVWQKKMLADIEQELDKRIASLEAKTAEYQKWLARRDEFSKKAQEQLVGIFSKMRPDAAAPQLAASDEETAAAVLGKLDTRISSAILSEMEPNQAARLTTIMVGAGKTAPGKSARVGPDGRRS
jgi:flagellar motility protein MotE (MotC chaperone)